MTELLASDWFVWGIGLILVFQLLVILLGEAIYRADRRTLPIGGIFRALRNIVLPLAVLFVFLTRLLEIERESVPVRLVETALWTSVVYAVLLVVNVLVFENAAEASWRSRAPKLFQDLIRLLLVVIGAAIVLSVVWRQDLGGLIAALGVGSIVLGLALQETLGNLMSGIALFFERPFSAGDWISVGGKSGQVVQITWRSVHLRTAERNLLVLPNSALGRETITNYSQPTDRANAALVVWLWSGCAAESSQGNAGRSRARDSADHGKTRRRARSRAKCSMTGFATKRASASSMGDTCRRSSMTSRRLSGMRHAALDCRCRCRVPSKCVRAPHDRRTRRPPANPGGAAARGRNPRVTRRRDRRLAGAADRMCSAPVSILSLPARCRRTCM